MDKLLEVSPTILLLIAGAALIIVLFWPMSDKGRIQRGDYEPHNAVCKQCGKQYPNCFAGHVCEAWIYKQGNPPKRCCGTITLAA